jgi:hypothetical protein
MKSVRKRLTYANVMSSIAVFLVLAGGTAFAASHLGKESVGTKQLKKEAVTAAKLKNGAVSGSKIAPGAVDASKINAAGLTVPNAAHAGTADSATNAGHAGTADSATNATNATNADNAGALGGVPASGYARNQLEAVNIVGVAGEPALEGGCVNLSAEFEKLGFYKDPFGIVHLQGEATGCSATFGATFTLPAGFRPAKQQIFSVHSASDTVPGAIRIEPTGQIERFSAQDAGLNGITFRAAN